MTLYIGDKPVGLMKVVEKKVPKTKFGISIDDLFGEVDKNGHCSVSDAPVLLDLSGVRSVGSYTFANLFYSKGKKEIVISAKDLVSVGANSFVSVAAGGVKMDKFVARFDSLVEINANNAFESFGPAGADDYDVVFSSLESVKGVSVFRNAFSGVFLAYNKIDLDSVFPKLRHIEGSTVFNSIVRSASSSVANIRLSSVETIIGGSASYSSTFYGVYVNLYVPNCTRVENYIFNPSYKCVVHFAAANQAAIEACPGYDKMFGAAEIYFDL